MTMIKGVPLSEKTALEIHGFIRNVTHHQREQYDDGMFYDITLKSGIHIVTRKYGIEIFKFDDPKRSHYMNKCMFMEVIIT